MTGKAMATRRACAEELAALGEQYRNLVVLDADISRSTYSCLFAERFPDRHINAGIAEQNLVGVAAGLSLCGMIPVCMTYAVFISMRALEQVRTAVCYPGLNVKFFVSHGGLTPGSDGATHQATEDLSVMSAIPGLTVAMPCDETETRLAVRAALGMRGPVYLRLTRCDVPPVYEEAPDFAFGRAIRVAGGDDASLFAVGDMVAPALRAREALLRRGIRVRVYDMHTLKPLDREAVLRAAAETGALVTAEDNNLRGGLGAAVAAAVCQARPVPVVPVGIGDRFGQSGDYEGLKRKFGLAEDDLADAVLRAVAMKGGKTDG